MKAGKLRLSARTDVGQVRDHNEDNFVIARDVSLKDWIFNDNPFVPGRLGTLLMVADGMGGTNAGEVASEIAVNSVRNFFSTLPADFPVDDDLITAKLCESIIYAHQQIVIHAREFPDTEGMGTTIIMSWIIGDKVYTGWSGDSRAYIYRPSQGLKQMSRDHSYVQELVNKGKITEEQAFYHPESNIITQSLGDKDHPPKPETRIFTLAKNDRVLLCSDGLCGMIMDDQITEILKKETEPSDCLKILIDEANKAGGHDNITVLMCEVVEGNEAENSVLTGETGKSGKNTKKMWIWILVAILMVVMAFVGIKSGLLSVKNSMQNIPKDTTVVNKPAKSGKSDSVVEKTVEKKTNNGKNQVIEQKNAVNADEKSALMSREDAAKLLKIMKKVNLYYGKLAITNDSINTASFKKHLNTLLKQNKPKTNDVCQEINSLLAVKLKLEYAVNLPFENAISELTDFRDSKCK